MPRYRHRRFRRHRRKRHLHPCCAPAPLAASTTHATVDLRWHRHPLTPGSHAAGAAVGLTYAASAASAAGTAIGTGSTPGSTLTAGAVVAVERLPQPALPADAASLADATGGAGTPFPPV